MKLAITCLLIIGLFAPAWGQQLKVLDIGDKAPDFFLPDLSGKIVSLEDLLKDDKELILVFWASWCPECRRQLPEMNRIAKQYGDKIKVVGINVLEPVRAVKYFVAEKGIGYQILLDPAGEVGWFYGIIGIPANVLINRRGLIKRAYIDIFQLESYLERKSKAD